MFVRPFTREDVDWWQAWPDYVDPLLVGTSPRRMTHEQRDRWFDDLLNRQKQLPFAIDDEWGEMIGRLFLRHVQRSEGSAVLGIDLHPDKLSLGYGTEAMAAFLPYYFGSLGFERMLLSVGAFNERARRCYAALGFRNIGSHWDQHVGPDVTRDPQFDHLRGVFRRGVMGVEALFYDMALMRAEWDRNQRRGQPR